VLRETTSQGLWGLVCPSRTSERGGDGDCVKWDPEGSGGGLWRGGGGRERERERERVYKEQLLRPAKLVDLYPSSPAPPTLVCADAHLGNGHTGGRMPLSARAQCQKRPITVSKETCSFQYLGNGIPGEDALISVAGEGVIRRGDHACA
jgi:hypothetical protein